ncbi:MAG: hypothetical protein KF878_11285 [Planctomycetes bacterium]|nr:hypothetical protein [Planctomycetota bacterium]
MSATGWQVWDRDRIVDVRSASGLVLLVAGRPRRRRAWRDDDAALAAEARAERLVALDAGFPGEFRLRVGRHAPAAPPRRRRPALRRRRRARAGDEAPLEGAGAACRCCCRAAACGSRSARPPATTPRRPTSS